MELLLKYSAYMRVRGVYSKGDRSTRFRVSKYQNRGKELLSEDKSGVKLGGPPERFSRTFEGVGEMSKDLGSISEKSMVEINHTEKTLQSGFI